MVSPTEVGGGDTPNGQVARKNQPPGQKRTGGFRMNDTSTIGGNNSLPRTGVVSITRSNQIAFINQKIRII